ncbi:MAG: D-alanyl-D-alanine carboxypeptidase/D-alanyl-D-alanine-endopeptidase [Acidobacteriota bacterium]
MAAATAGAQTSKLPAELADRVDRLVASRGDQRVGICVRKLDGEVLYQRSSADLYELASNTKLLTTSAALDTLGHNFGFVTRVYARGDVDYFGNLDGDLVLSGTGDASLTGKFRTGDIDGLVDEWVASIREKGISSVMGNIVVARNDDFDPKSEPDNAMGGDFEGANEPDEDEEIEDLEVSTPTEALLIEISPGKVGRRATLGIRPAGSSLKVLNNCLTVPGSVRQIAVSRGRANVITVSGRIGASAGTVTEILAYGDPELMAASLLRQNLPHSGVPVRGDIRVAMQPTSLATDPGTILIAEARAELSDTLNVVNKRSHNQSAEEILRVMGAQAGAASGRDLQTRGCSVVTDFLLRSGIPRGTFSVVDGSGLSHGNRMSPESLSLLLTKMASTDSATVFKSSLAVPGEDGTLRARLPGIERYANVAAKTGHIGGVNTLSGYLDTRKGGYVFSVLTNGHHQADNGLLDGIVTQIASALAVSDGSITAADAAPAPSYAKVKASSHKHRKSSHRSSSSKSPSKSSKKSKSSSKKHR